MIEPLVPRVVRHLVPRVRHPVRPLLRLLMPPPVGRERQGYTPMLEALRSWLCVIQLAS